MSCLLYRLSYIAVADKVAFDAGTHSSSAAACQCGSNHSRWRQTLTKTSVTMSAAGAHQNSTVAAGGPIPASRFHRDMCMRELFGTPWSRNSIWSARSLRLLRMKAS